MALLIAIGGVCAAGTIELRILGGLPRFGAPVTSGVPFPKGELRDAEHVRLLRDGQEVPAQFRVTGQWLPDESVRWLLVDFQTDVKLFEQQKYTLEYGPEVRAKPVTGIRIEENNDAYSINTGAALFSINKKYFDLFQDVRLGDGKVLVSRATDKPRSGAIVRGLQHTATRAIPGPGNKGHAHLISVTCSPQAGLEDYTLRFTSANDYEVSGAKAGAVGSGVYLKDFTSKNGQFSIPADAWLRYAQPAAGDVFTFRTIPEHHAMGSDFVQEALVLERGPLRTVLRLKGFIGSSNAPVLEFTAWYHFYAGSGEVKLAFTLENNNHGGRTPDGNARNANIGGVNCVSFDEMVLRLPVALQPPGQVYIGGANIMKPSSAPLGTTAAIYQDSSGGEQWNRYRDEKFHPRPNSYVSFKGYRLSVGDTETEVAERALGWLDVSEMAKGLTVGVRDFWQNYPKALSVDKDGVVEIGLFPGRYAADFSLRSGEHKTHEILFFFHPGVVGTNGNKAIVHAFSTPFRLEPSPKWFAQTRALGDLHPFDPVDFQAYEARNLSAIGKTTDGEYVAPPPNLITRRHENEFYGWMDFGDVPIDFEAPSGQWGMKYDLDYWMAVQYARTLESRWWDFFVAADRHTADIDVHHQPHYPGLHFVKGGVWAHSTHAEPGHKNPHRNYNHFTKDLSFGARGTALLYHFTGDWKAHDACLEIAENALAEYMSPQKVPGPPERNNRMGCRGDGCTLNRLLEGYLLSGEEKYLQRARWEIKSCAFDGKPAKHEPISLWSSLFYMEALARYVEMFPEDASAKSYLLAHINTLQKSVDPQNGIYYTITPRPDGSVTGNGECSHYNVMAADMLALGFRLTGRADLLESARLCFAYGVKNANGKNGGPGYYQVHSANGGMHGNLFMTIESATKKTGQ